MVDVLAHPGSLGSGLRTPERVHAVSSLGRATGGNVVSAYVRYPPWSVVSSFEPGGKLWLLGTGCSESS